MRYSLSNFACVVAVALGPAATGCGGTDPGKQMCIDADNHCGGGGNYSRCHDDPNEYELCQYECVLEIVDCIEFHKQLYDKTRTSGYYDCLDVCWRDYGGTR